MIEILDENGTVITSGFIDINLSTVSLSNNSVYFLKVCGGRLDCHSSINVKIYIDGVEKINKDLENKAYSVPFRTGISSEVYIKVTMNA